MGTKKEYKVIEIIDNFTILINYGTKDNAKKDDQIKIFERGDNVIDPDSKEVIGTLDIFKDTVSVFVTYENFSICKKIENIYYSILSPLANLGKSTDDSSIEINVDPNDFTNKKYSTDAPIKVGDLAVIAR